MTPAEQKTLQSLARSLQKINAHISFIVENIRVLSVGNDNEPIEVKDHNQ